MRVRNLTHAEFGSVITEIDLDNLSEVRMEQNIFSVE